MKQAAVSRDSISSKKKKKKPKKDFVFGLFSTERDFWCFEGERGSLSFLLANII
jgi:hypothetical protein